MTSINRKYDFCHFAGAEFPFALDKLHFYATGLSLISLIIEFMNHYIIIHMGFNY
jgi:hypothetical protein